MLTRIEKPKGDNSTSRYFIQSPLSLKSAWILAAAGSFGILLIRIFLAAQQRTCGVPDSCSYFSLARSISEKHKLIQNFTTTFQISHMHLPMTGLEYWRPGSSFAMLLAQPFGGVTLFSSLVVTILAGFVLAAAAYYTAWKLTGDVKISIGAYLICLSLPQLWTYSAMPDSTLYYGACAGWFLALLGVRSHNLGRDLAAMGAAAATNLVRNDAPLLLFPLLAVLILRIKYTPSEHRRRAYAYSGLLIALFFVAMLVAPFVNRVFTGSWVSSATERVLFVNNFKDFVNYRPVTIHIWLSIGLKALVLMRIKMLAMITYRVVFLCTGFGALFILGCFGWNKRDGKRESIAPFCTMLIASLGAYGLVLPAIGQYSMLRTFSGLLPFAATLIVIGIVRLAYTERARFAIVAGCFIFYLISGTMVSVDMARSSVQAARGYQAISRLIYENGGPGVVMTTNPAQLSTITGLRAIPIPGEGGDVLREVVQKFGVRYIIADDSDEEHNMLPYLNARKVAEVPDSPMILLEMND